VKGSGASHLLLHTSYSIQKNRRHVSIPAFFISYLPPSPSEGGEVDSLPFGEGWGGV
jgi:hypothetical protein